MMGLGKDDSLQQIANSFLVSMLDFWSVCQMMLLQCTFHIITTSTKKALGLDSLHTPRVRLVQLHGIPSYPLNDGPYPLNDGPLP